MSGGKGKSHGGKAGHKAGAEGRTQVSHSAKAGLQVGFSSIGGSAFDARRFGFSLCGIYAIDFLKYS